MVSFTEGTGNRGSELWKLYSIGFGPENNFTNTWGDNIGSRVMNTFQNKTMTRKTLLKKHALTGTVLKLCYKTLDSRWISKGKYFQSWVEVLKWIVHLKLKTLSEILHQGQTHQPNLCFQGQRSMAIEHPAMPGQQRLKDVPHNESHSNPQSCPNQHTTNNTLPFFCYVLTAGTLLGEKCNTLFKKYHSFHQNTVVAVQC